MFRFSIRDIEVYHGAKVQDNKMYIDHFKARGKDIEHFFRDVIGRDKRYLIDSEKENTLTMAVTAAKSVLNKSNLSGEDLDMIIFSSQLPEYIAPPSSIHIHQALGCKVNCICYDINVNCTGMSTALEHTAKYMSVSDNINRALIIGCDYLNMTADPESEYCYGLYGDAACAMIIEKTTEEIGLLDSLYSIYSGEHNNILFPGCGFSNLFKVNDKKELLLNWSPLIKIEIEGAVHDIKTVLDRNNLTVNDIKMFCFSQYVYKNVEQLRSLLAIGEEKSLYVGGEYGYTGTTSPFIVLYKSLKEGLVKKGDYVMIWTVGAGTSNIAVLLKL
jgi:3-oxoacyl-[acyl-carrier-protein] synthase III